MPLISYYSTIKHIHHKADSLVARMSSLLSPHRQRPRAQMTKKPLNIIEISDDDELADTASDSGDASDSELSDLGLSPSATSRPQNKRRKLGHVRKDFAPMRKPLGSDQTMVTSLTSQMPFAKANLAFPDRHYEVTQASLTFRNTASPPKATTQIIRPRPSLAETRQQQDFRQRDNKTVRSPPKAKEPVIAPYYDDVRLEIRMYRGPGYERFPIVLGSIDGHKELCEKWDGKQLRRRRRREEKSRLQFSVGGHSYDAPIDVPESSASDAESVLKQDNESTKKKLDCLRAVLEILPHIEQSFVLQRIKAHTVNTRTAEDGHVQDIPNVEKLIEEILEMESYPREQVKHSKKHHSPELDASGRTIARDKNPLVDSSYRKEAVRILAINFDHVPTHYIQRVMQDKKSLFDAFVDLHETEKNYFSLAQRPYVRPRLPRMVLEKKYARAHHESRNTQTYAGMVNELQAAKQHVFREELRLNKEKEKEAFEAANLEAHRADGALVECQCCFDDEIPLNRAVSCEADTMHFFCFECVGRLADSQVGIMQHEMRCMDGSGCKAILSADAVSIAVPIKTLDRLAFNAQQAEISSAGLEGLEQCPYCDFKAVCDSVEIAIVFNCQKPDCLRSSCRKCKLDAHVPKTCEEVQKDQGLSARHQVEEARSDAMMRTCPKCGVKIVKELGCNKMRCQCGCILCYVCKTDISGGREGKSSSTKPSRNVVKLSFLSAGLPDITTNTIISIGGYEHFHRPGARCKLYDDPGVDRHVLDAVSLAPPSSYFRPQNLLGPLRTSVR